MSNATFSYGDSVRVRCSKNHFLRNHRGKTGVIVGGSGDDRRTFDVVLDEMNGRDTLKAVPADQLERSFR